MIILNETQKDQVKGIYGKWNYLEPREIQNNLWTLPEVILENDVFSDAFSVLNDCSIRPVDPSEYIQYEL